ncbi:MAG: hypothetical protein O2999_11325 [Nitrospirae bacterium]|nr:hypothetical protein [Nitrospirota bacterium]MDA1304870.1 hypothetical protein [Nitrospirota bacterium]
MERSESYSQLGLFIVQFQNAETALTELLTLMAGTDDEAVLILVNELEYSQRVKTTDVMFARFIDLHRDTDKTVKQEFHRLMVELLRLGERRNEMVHSRYWDWQNIEGSMGLLRQNSKLRASRGTRDEHEEELLPEAFDKDLESLSKALGGLEHFRLRVIDWLYPDVEA